MEISEKFESVTSKINQVIGRLLVPSTQSPEMKEIHGIAIAAGVELDEIVNDVLYPDLPNPNVALTFGQAIEALKNGKRVARKGWDNKDMWIVYLRGTNTDSGKNTTLGDYAVNTEISDSLGLLPFLAMKTVSGDLVPWVASQTDILAEDWQIVD